MGHIRPSLPVKMNMRQLTRYFDSYDDMSLHCHPHIVIIIIKYNVSIVRRYKYWLIYIFHFEWIILVTYCYISIFYQFKLLILTKKYFHVNWQSNGVFLLLFFFFHHHTVTLWSKWIVPQSIKCGHEHVSNHEFLGNEWVKSCQ